MCSPYEYKIGVQEIHYSGDEENSKVVDDIEIAIVEHKIGTDI